MTNDSRWVYRWDGENRLIGMETDTNKVGSAGVPRQKLAFQYDAQSRRISKVVSNLAGGVWVEASNLRFIYDGWNLLAEVDKTNGIVRNYAWGLDLSGTEQGAGGIGGLLWVNLPQATNTQARGSHFVAFDGNGNVAALLNSQTAQTSAEYEYGPFGETVRATGPAASENVFRFSAKYTDAETGLLYYGYRYYQPSTGRWVNRDPIEEKGGENIYVFVGNTPVTTVDALGLAVATASRRRIEGVAEDQCPKCCRVFIVFQYNPDPASTSVEAPSERPASNAQLIREWQNSVDAAKQAGRVVIGKQVDDIGAQGVNLRTVFQEVKNNPGCSDGISVILIGHGNKTQGMLFPIKIPEQYREIPEWSPAELQRGSTSVWIGREVLRTGGIRQRIPGVTVPTWTELWRDVKTVHARHCYSAKNAGSFEGLTFTGYSDAIPSANDEAIRETYPPVPSGERVVR